MKNEYGLQDSIRIQRPFLPEDAGPSWQSRFLVRLLRLLPARKMLASPARVQERVRKLALKPASYQPTALDQISICNCGACWDGPFIKQRRQAIPTSSTMSSSCMAAAISMKSFAPIGASLVI